MKKVLLVDDVRLFLEMEKNILSKRGDLGIFTATSGLEALKVLKAQTIDLVLCDLYMPEMNGDELCKIMRKDDALKDVPFIMVTTSDSQEDIDRCVKAGVNDCFSKPVRPAELLNKISSYIKIPLRKNQRISVNIAVISPSGAASEQPIGNALDISTGGFLLETGQTFEIGKTGYFLLMVPDGNQQIGASCEIVRNASGERPDLNYYGIKCLNLKEADKRAIEEYIKIHPEDLV